MDFSCQVLVILGLAFVYVRVGCTPVELSESRAISKRHLRNFGEMVECETNGDKWRYNGYGCWCGYGGAGEPLDGTDRCCYDHDKCYDKLMAEGSACTTRIDPYVVSYKFSNCSTCAPASKYNAWDWVGWTTVECRVEICKCDAMAAKCFAQNVFNHKHASYDKVKCQAKINV